MKYIFPAKNPGVIVVLIGIYIFAFYGCNNDTNRSNAERVVYQWHGKTITIPNDIKLTNHGSNSSEIPIQTPYKILLYVDSAGCSSCKLNLSQWDDYIKEIDSIAPGKVQFEFWFAEWDSNEITTMLEVEGFKHPVFIDEENRINKLNGFPEQMEYQCFLLNSENEVIMIGNPILINAVKEVYMNVITS